MQTASFGAFTAPSGEIFVNVRKGDQGVPLMWLLPVSAQGDGFGEFNVCRFFDVVQLWLVTHEQWVDLVRSTDTSEATKIAPVQANAPGFDLEAYGLINAENELDYAALAELVSAVARLWDHKPLITPQSGLICKLYRAGLTPDEIFEHITEKAADGAPNENGVIQLDAVKPSPGFAKAAGQSLSQAASKQFKKNRKQGRLNRKRGRR